MPRKPIFHPYRFGAEERARLDDEGHFALPGLLNQAAQAELTDALADIQSVPEAETRQARHYSAERSAYLASLIAHPQLLTLARQVLGPEIRYDHCVSLNRPAADRGASWHSHEYA